MVKKQSKMECGGCGYKYIGDTKCPSCDESLGKSDPEGDDMTKKTFDAPDLKKAW